MKISTSQVTKLSISDMPNMDPISAIIEDFGPGAGKITITSFGEAWTHYWSHMGKQHTMRSFFLKCETPYLIGKLSNGIRKQITDEDDEALVEILCKEVIKRRRCHDLSPEMARDMWDNCLNVHFGEHQDLCSEILGDEWWGDLPKKTNPDYEHLGKIVDTVKAALALESLQGQPAFTI